MKMQMLSFVIKLAIQNSSPALFASVMGTGVFAIASQYYSFLWAGFNTIAILLWVISIIFFLGVAIPWVMRWLCYCDYALKDLNHPVNGQYYATMPIACLVLAVNFILFGPSYLGPYLALLIAKSLWIIGTVVALIIAVIIPVLNYFNKVTIEDINPAWFMPPVSLLVVPIAGAPLIPCWPQYLQKILLVINFMAWGMGFFLFLFIAVISFYRFLVTETLPGSLAPTIWIYLGPIGAGTISFLNLGSVSSLLFGNMTIPIHNILGLIYWSFGFWWFIAASIMTSVYLRKKNLPYALSGGAYIFPIGACTVATYLISMNLKCNELEIFGFLCYLLLTFCWITAFFDAFSRIYGVLLKIKQAI